MLVVIAVTSLSPFFFAFPLHFHFAFSGLLAAAGKNKKKS
jgi:hypothetical protein